MSPPTQSAMLEGRVHGVVVQASRMVSSSPTMGRATVTAGSWTLR